ncbi:Vitamin B12-binding protein [subsurface metagenome]
MGTTIYCDRPPEAKEKEKVGTVIKVDVEKIVILKPDLILATSLTDPGQIEKLKSLGIRVISFPLYKNENFSQICEQFMEIGRIVGKEEEAEEIVRQMKNKIDSISKKVKGLPRSKVFVQIGARPLFAITKDSFIQDLITLAGGISTTREAKSGLYSREDVIRQNPEVIIIVTMGIVGEEEKKIWKRFKTLDAARNDRIYIIDSNKTCSPTPVSFVEALEEITEFLHPEERN